jgi:hypothetical protein
MSPWIKRGLLGLLASLGIFAAIFFGEVSRAETANQAAAQAFFERAQHGTQGHTNNWAVLVCASRYWFNYRVGLLIPNNGAPLTRYLAHGKCTWNVSKLLQFFRTRTRI